MTSTQATSPDLVLHLHSADIYQGSVRILQSVNLQLKRGEFCYLVGKTGAGKTSLLKTLYGALPFKHGMGFAVGFDLQKLKRRTLPKLRRKLGIVFQDFNLLTDRSVEANLDFVLRATGHKKKSDRDTRITHVLEMVNLPEKRNAMPFELSGGEQQRVMIARALLNEPELIIADEPTGNLDPDTSDDILELLQRICKEEQATVLMATHDYRVIEHFPGRVIRLQDGSVIDAENDLS